MEQAPRLPLLCALALLACPAALGCRTSPSPAPPPPPAIVLGIGPSVLPNLGLSTSAALRVREDAHSSTWIETEATFQFLDDADFANDGNPSAGNWVQLRAGGKLAILSTAARAWTARAGLLWFHAAGEPNIVDESGNHYGGYIALGFETRLGEHLSMGPELAVMPSFARGGGDFRFVPQATWRLLWRL